MRGVATKLFTVFFMMLLSGCASMTLAKPEIHVTRIQLGKTSLAGQDFEVELSVKNPNALPLNAKGLYFELWANGQKLATGESTRPLTIPANGEGTVPISLHTSLAAWLNQAGVALGSGQKTVNYRIEGYLDDLDGWGRLPFSRDGSWALPY
jgi:LEA14-like dessication related protein